MALTPIVKRVVDASGRYWFDPDSVSHTYGYNGSGQLTTDTANDGAGNTWVKTYTWTGSQMTSESQWVASGVAP